ncbi:MAG TPA: acyltransferase [Bacteroidia bacterium]
MKAQVHPHAIVESSGIGDDTRIWAFVHILENVRIGNNCNICDHCFIESNVTIGNNVTIKSGVYIWSGTVIEDDAFIGPNVVFTNDLRPRSKKKFDLKKITVSKGASIGANSTLLAGVTIGRYAMSGIGSVITRDVKDQELVFGNPARHQGWLDENGEKLLRKGKEWISLSGTRYLETEKGLQRIA